MSQKANDPVGSAYLAFVDIFHPGKTGMGLYFWHFLGLQYAPDQAGETIYRWGLTENSKRIIDMLNGPHAAALAKALVIQGHDPYKQAGWRPNGSGHDSNG